MLRGKIRMYSADHRGWAAGSGTDLLLLTEVRAVFVLGLNGVIFFIPCVLYFQCIN